MAATGPATAVTMAIPPPPVAYMAAARTEEERRDTGHPVSPDGGALGSRSWLELWETGGATVGHTLVAVEVNLSPKLVEAQAWAGSLPILTGDGVSEAAEMEGA